MVILIKINVHSLPVKYDTSIDLLVLLVKTFNENHLLAKTNNEMREGTYIQGQQQAKKLIVYAEAKFLNV
jgi:hypothetical protein